MAVSQAKQGQMTMWESVEQRAITWISRISFQICPTYDVLPSPQNLSCWALLNTSHTFNTSSLGARSASPKEDTIKCSVLAAALQSKRTLHRRLAIQKNHRQMQCTVPRAFVWVVEGRHKHQPRARSGELEVDRA